MDEEFDDSAMCLYRPAIGNQWPVEDDHDVEIVRWRSRFRENPASENGSQALGKVLVDDAVRRFRRLEFIHVMFYELGCCLK